MKYLGYGSNRTVNLSLKIDDSTHEVLIDWADMLDVSKSEIIRRAILKYRPTKKEMEAARNE